MAHESTDSSESTLAKQQPANIPTNATEASGDSHSHANQTGKPRWYADAILLAVATIWGINIPIVKWATQSVDHLSLNAVRLTLGAIALGMFTWWDARKRQAVPIPWFQVILIAVLGSLLYQYAFIQGINSASAGDTGLILGTIPMWTAIIAWGARVERLKAGAWIGLAIVATGTAIITVKAGGLDLSKSTSVGNLLVLSAAILWAITTVLTRPLVRTFSPVLLAFLMMIIVLPGHWYLAWPKVMSFAEIDWRLWLATIYSGTLSTGIAYALWNTGIKLVGPSHAAAYQNVAPVIALIASWITLGEPVLMTQLIGGPLIIGGLILMRRHR